MTVTILTGASRGIGRAIAEVILKDPENKLVAIARTKEKLEELAAAFPGQVAIVAGDVTDEAVAIRAVVTAVTKFGKLDALILNAGVIEPVGTIDSVPIDQWKDHFDVNFFSLVSQISAAMPELRKSKGRVIAVSSGASTSHYSGWYAYGCAKAAVNHLIMSVAKEERDVKAISVAPGVVKTDMQTDIREKCTQMGNDHQRFLDLFANNQLLDPVVPGTIYANLAVKGWDAAINGQYFRYNDEKLVSYK